MRNYCFGLIGALALVLSFAPSTAQAETITPVFFDGFEGDVGDVLDSSLAKWNVTAGSVDVLSAGNLCGNAGHYSNCVDLDGTGDMAGTIETKQAFSVSPGTYRLSFDLAGANRKWSGSVFNTVVVSFGSYFSQALTPYQWAPFETYTYDIEVADVNSTKIGFSHGGSDWIGLLLDNVSLSKVTFDEPPTEVIRTPEPGAFEVIALLVGLAVFRFRKTAAGMMARG